jgi:hypothetical protein
MLGWFKVVTNYRTFQVEAAGIGDAIERGLLLLMKEQGEYVREITAA